MKVNDEKRKVKEWKKEGSSEEDEGRKRGGREKMGEVNRKGWREREEGH